jgi:energy-coupling factor transporter ATP-binding protein EcfA2
VDIGAIEFIHRRLVELRDAGKAILLVSVELEEILALSDRILVMAGVQTGGEVAARMLTPHRWALLMGGINSEIRTTVHLAALGAIERAVRYFNLLAALLVTGLVTWLIGEDHGNACNCWSAVLLAVRGHRPYAVLHHRLHFYRSGRDGLSCRAV